MTDFDAQPVREHDLILCFRGEPTPKGSECHLTGEACPMDRPEWWKCDVYKSRMERAMV